MTYDGLSQRAPRLVRARPPHGSDLVLTEATDTLFRRVYEFGWNEGNAVLDHPQPLWGTCRPPLRLAAPPCRARLALVHSTLLLNSTSTLYYLLLDFGFTLTLPRIVAKLDGRVPPAAGYVLQPWVLNPLFQGGSHDKISYLTPFIILQL